MFILVVWVHWGPDRGNITILCFFFSFSLWLFLFCLILIAVLSPTLIRSVVYCTRDFKIMMHFLGRYSFSYIVCISDSSVCRIDTMYLIL